MWELLHEALLRPIAASVLYASDYSAPLPAGGGSQGPVMLPAQRAAALLPLKTTAGLLSALGAAAGQAASSDPTQDAGPERERLRLALLQVLAAILSDYGVPFPIAGGPLLSPLATHDASGAVGEARKSSRFPVAVARPEIGLFIETLLLPWLDCAAGHMASVARAIYASAGSHNAAVPVDAAMTAAVLSCSCLANAPGGAIHAVRGSPVGAPGRHLAGVG